MIDLFTFREMVSDILDELPPQFYKDLNGGILVEEYCKVSPYGDDLFILGEYQRSNLGRMVKLYYGSFDRLYSWMSEEQMKQKIRDVVRHEFTHHMESLAGEKGLEIWDREQLKKYLENKNRA